MLEKIVNAVMPKGWTPDSLGDLSGKYYVITGGNSGLGLETTRILAARGAEVSILCRSEARAREALALLAQDKPKGRIDFIPLDLADLASVRRVADTLHQRTGKLDGMINNAGLMAMPTREVTRDGFEMQFGVNHLAHFALSGLVADLVDNAGGRFVTVSSIAHKSGRIYFPDLQSDQSYKPWRAYGQSKLANLLFAQELHRRLRQAGKTAQSIACHPGVSATNLFKVGSEKWKETAVHVMGQLFFQSAERGAWPEVMAAAAPEAVSGRYYGPTGPREAMGPVGESQITERARDKEVAAKLWAVSEALTGVIWPLLR